MFHKRMIGIISIIGMLLCIFDARAAVNAAGEAINLCLLTVIPSLFPYFFLSNAMLYGMSDWNGRFFSKLCGVIGIPSNGGPVLVGSILGGYPTGALLITESWRTGVLEKKTAHGLLGFCNNAGPAFIFGMVSQCFSKNGVPWLLWGIHILSAILTGFVFREKQMYDMVSSLRKKGSFTQILQNSIRSMATVCGWVILFRILTDFCKRLFLWYFPTISQVLFVSFLELTNGCLALESIPQESLRFVLCAGMLSWGGLCVAMQTVSVTQSLGTGMYFPGKLLQTLISILCATLLCPALYHDENHSVFYWTISLSFSILIFVFLIIKKLWHSKRNCSILV